MTGQSPWPRELRTERLLLRRWLQADREPFASMNADFDHPKVPNGHALCRHVLYRIDESAYREAAARRAP